MTSDDTLRFHVLSHGAVPVLSPYPNYSSHHINMAGARRDTQRYGETPVCVVQLSFNSKMANLHRETRLCCPPSFPFKNGQLTQRYSSMLSTFLSIQRRPTYRGKPVYVVHLFSIQKRTTYTEMPVYVVHLSIHSKSAN